MTNQTPLPHAVELLPCPFCGRVGLTFEEGSTYRWGIASCEWCGATAGETRRAYPDDGKWHADAIAAWNKRATPAQAAPEAVSRHAPQARALLDIAQYLAGHLQMVQDRIDAALATPSAVPSPSAAEDAMDAKRYRWLLSFGNALYVEWRHDCAHGPTALNAAIDAALSTGPQKAKGPGAHTEASEAGQEPPTHGASVAALQREVEELRAANERMAEWINGDCFCPCCGNTIACTDGCDFATDCPDAAQRMAEARAVLYGASKAEVPNG